MNFIDRSRETSCSEYCAGHDRTCHMFAICRSRTGFSQSLLPRLLLLDDSCGLTLERSCFQRRETSLLGVEGWDPLRILKRGRERVCVCIEEREATIETRNGHRQIDHLCPKSVHSDSKSTFLQLKKSSNSSTFRFSFKKSRAAHSYLPCFLRCPYTKEKNMYRITRKLGRWPSFRNLET